MRDVNISAGHARRFLMLHQGLIAEKRFFGKQGVVDFIRQAGCLQYDPIDICGKNSEIALQSRISGFDKDILYSLLYEDRTLLDYFDKNLAIILTEDFPCFRRTREYFADGTRSEGHVDTVEAEIKDFIKKNIFASSKDFKLGNGFDWYWSRTTLARAALETLYFRGELIIHHKKGTNKYYSLAEDFLPADVLHGEDPNKTVKDYHKWALMRRLRAVGMLMDKSSDAFLGIRGFKASERAGTFRDLLEEDRIRPITVDGISGMLYYSAEDEKTLSLAENPELMPRMELIAPLDSLIWDRRLVESVFGFRYRWEIYNRPEDRVFGYYVLPITYGDRFVGRAELLNDKKRTTLLVKNVWYEEGIKADKKLKAALDDCLKRFAEFNRCDKIARI